MSSSASKLAHFNIFWKSWSTYLSKKYSKKKLMILTVKLGLTSQFLASRVNIIVVLIFMKNILASFVFINIQILDYIEAIKMINLLCIIINQGILNFWLDIIRGSFAPKSLLSTFILNSNSRYTKLKYFYNQLFEGLVLIKMLAPNLGISTFEYSWSLITPAGRIQCKWSVYNWKVQVQNNFHGCVWQYVSFVVSLQRKL